MIACHSLIQTSSYLFLLVPVLGSKKNLGCTCPWFGMGMVWRVWYIMQFCSLQMHDTSLVFNMELIKPLLFEGNVVMVSPLSILIFFTFMLPWFDNVLVIRLSLQWCHMGIKPYWITGKSTFNSVYCSGWQDQKRQSSPLTGDFQRKWAVKCIHAVLRDHHPVDSAIFWSSLPNRGN